MSQSKNEKRKNKMSIPLYNERVCDKELSPIAKVTKITPENALLLEAMEGKELVD